MRQVIITKLDENQRLNKFLAKYLNKASQSFIYKMLRKKNIKVNNKKADGSEILTQGDTLQIYLSEDTLVKFMEEKLINESAGSISIVYEDNNVLFINKPIGVLSHPNNNTDKDTVIDRILLYLNKKGEYNLETVSTFVPAICNRLDRNTSGIIVCGKNLAAVQQLNEIILNNNMYKYYRAIVNGKLSKQGALSGYHVKNNNTNEVKILESKFKNGKKVFTKYIPIEYTNDFTLLKINLVTGKSHQIRAHLQTINHPILGDRKYGNEKLNMWAKKKFSVNNQLLHAEEIFFKKADGVLKYLEGRSFFAAPPSIFIDVENNIFKSRR